jgi:hypothetical protein
VPSLEFPDDHLSLREVVIVPEREQRAARNVRFVKGCLDIGAT